MRYVPTNRVLQERIGYLLNRPVGRPSNDVCRSYASFTYQRKLVETAPSDRQGRIASIHASA